MELGYRFAKLHSIEVRPHASGEQQFRIGAFPKQKVAEPLLASGSNQKIDGFTLAQKLLKGFWQ